MEMEEELKHEVSREVRLFDRKELRHGAGDVNVEGRAAVDAMIARARMLCLEARGDVDAAKEAEKAIRELKSALDFAEDELAWPNAVGRADVELEEARRIVGEGGEGTDAEILAATEKRLKSALGSRDAIVLRELCDELHALSFRVLARQPHFWVAILRDLDGRRALMSEEALAVQLFAQAERALAAEDFSSLRAAVQQLYSLLPEEEQASAKIGGFGGGTLK
jgi:molecular chaperone DnaK